MGVKIAIVTQKGLNRVVVATKMVNANAMKDTVGKPDIYIN